MAEGPTLRCRELGPLEAGSLPALRQAFRDAPGCELGQAWLSAPHADLRPGQVRAGMQGESLALLAELRDDDIHSRASAPNQRFWEIGDTFEIFLSSEGASHYLELHVAPNGHALQLRVPIPRPEGTTAEMLMIDEPLFERRAWIEPGRWSVFAKVPFSSTGGRPARFSFSRYDYTRGKTEPVLSSTSPHAELNFHRRQEWGRLAYS